MKPLAIFLLVMVSDNFKVNKQIPAIPISNFLNKKCPLKKIKWTFKLFPSILTSLPEGNILSDNLCIRLLNVSAFLRLQK